MGTTKENNKLIAEFIGMQKTDIGWFDNEEVLKLYHTNDNTFDFLEFSTSWDWLMPVVEKIEDIGSEVVITNAECNISAPNGYYEETISKSRMGATYNAVVEFIIWYNKKLG